MPHTNDKPSERSSTDLDAVSRATAQDRATARPRQRVVIRTAENRFDTYPYEPPHDMDWQWKVSTVNGKEAREQKIAWALNGWVPVPAGRLPEFTGEDVTSKAQIERGGLILCERPKHVGDQVREDEKRAAKEQVQAQMERLEGRARATQSTRVTKSSRSYEPITDDN